MGIVRQGVKGATRALLGVVADRVARDDLFEKPGERAPTHPLPPGTAPAAGEDEEPASEESSEAEPVATDGAAAPASELPAAAAEPGQGSDALPADGCVPADLDLLRAAHGPGPRPRIVNHWATWCLPCIDELPHIVALAQELDGQADVLGVSWDLFDPRGEPDEIVDHVADFARGNGISWPSVLVTAPSEDFFSALEIGWQKIPQTWVISPQGEVLRKVEGVLDADTCAELAALVRES